MPPDESPKEKLSESRGFDLVKGSYWIKKPDGEKMEWTIKATHDKPETIEAAMQIADDYKTNMETLLKRDDWTEKEKMQIHKNSTIKLLEMVFGNFNYQAATDAGINYVKLSNTSEDIKRFLVEVGGLDEFRLLTQRNEVMLSMSNITKT